MKGVGQTEPFFHDETVASQPQVPSEQWAFLGFKADNVQSSS